MIGNRTAVGSRLSDTARVISYVLPTGMYAVDKMYNLCIPRVSTAELYHNYAINIVLQTCIRCCGQLGRVQFTFPK